MTKPVITNFRVKGKLPFPLDMLRYDTCWPTDSESVDKIQASLARDGDDFIVSLSMSGLPTTARWASFGWTVLTVNGKPQRC